MRGYRLSIWMGAAILASSFALTASAQQIHPSFNCQKARYPDEVAICGDDHLAQLDQAANIALGQVPKDSMKDAREGAIEQLKSRHACGSNKVCILDNQALAIDLIDGYGPKVQVPPWVGSYRVDLLSAQGTRYVNGLPTTVGACTKTKIAGITSRFGGQIKRPDSDGTDAGSAVNFANKGYVVSYSYEEAVADSAIGDDVIMCLVSIPKDCPPGDERGRFYSTTNLRTMGSWILPDAEHMRGRA